MNDEADLADLMHTSFDQVTATSELRKRLMDAGGKLDRRPERARRPRVRAVGASIAAACAVVVILGLIQIFSAHDRPSGAAPTDPTVACSDPRIPFARFWVITSGGVDESIYQGSVTVGTATVPAYSLYVSGGAPGSGTLCVADGAGARSPIQSTAQAMSGVIAYVGSVDGVLYFGLRPAATSARVAYGGSSSEEYSLDGRYEQQLQSIGDGWHAVAAGYGQGPVTAEIQAFDATGQQIGIYKYALSMSGVQTSAPATSR